MTDEWVSSDQLEMVRTEEWYHIIPESYPGINSLILGVYLFDGHEVVVASEAAVRVMRGEPESPEEGDWVLLKYTTLADNLASMGWGQM